MENCKNCDHSLLEEQKFCPNCGQKAIERLKVRTLLGELASAFLSWDSKLFRTLKLLLFKPGAVSKNYISGRRKSYVAPMRIYLFFSVAFFVCLNFFGQNNSGGDREQDFDLVDVNLGEDNVAMSKDSLLIMAEHDRLDELPLIRDQESDFRKYLLRQLVLMDIHQGGFTRVFVKNISYMFFFFIPVFAWLLKVFYRKKKFDYIEHLVFALYFHSFIFCVFLIFLLLYRAIGIPWIFLVSLGFILIHYLGGVKRFYETTLGNAVLKFIFLFMLYMFIFAIFSLLTTLITILLYNG